MKIICKEIVFLYGNFRFDHTKLKAHLEFLMAEHNDRNTVPDVSMQTSLCNVTKSIRFLRIY